MNHPEKGALVRLIDDFGRDAGLAIFMELHPPHSELPNGKTLDLSWHFSVLDGEGDLRLLNTSDWTLIPADPDSCNP